ARGPDEHDELLVANLQVDVFDGVHGVVKLVDVFEDYLRHATSISLPSTVSFSLSSLFRGERVGVRGRRLFRRRLSPPVTLALSPCLKRHGERGSIIPSHSPSGPRRSARRRTSRRPPPGLSPEVRPPSADPRRTRRRGSAPTSRRLAPSSARGSTGIRARR